MQNDQTTQDAKRLRGVFSTNHSEARMVSPHGLDKPFSPSWADAEQAWTQSGPPRHRDAVASGEEYAGERRGAREPAGHRGGVHPPNTVRCSGSPILGGSYWKRSGRTKAWWRKLMGR